MTRLSLRTAALAAAALALLVHLPALANGFAYDDVGVILNDPRVHGLGSIPEIFAGGYWHADADLSLWRPLTTLSFALDWAVSGGSPAWFHFTNLLWHALATALATTLLGALAGAGPALLGGALFAVHPVHVEAIANVVGRAELIAASCCFAAALLWASPAGRSAPLATRRVLAVAGLYLAALLAKESAIVLPALLALVDLATGALDPRRPLAWLRLRARALIVLAITAALLLGARAAALGQTLPTRVDPVLEVASAPLARIFTALQAWPHILRLFLFPATLLADYSARIIMPALAPTPLTWAGALIWLALVMGGLAAARAGRGHAALALLWVPVALLPLSNFFFPVGVLLAERTLYLPSFALATGAALGATAARGRVRPALLGALGVLACATLALRSLARIPEWRSTDAVMVSLLRDRPDAFRARWHLARSAAVRADTTIALQQYAAALRLWPYRRALVLEAADIANRFGDRPFARQIIEHGARSWPRDLAVLRLAAGTALDMNDTAAARTHIAAGLRVQPDDSLLLRMNQAIHR